MIEKVNPSHPDKVADRIAGAIVDLGYKIQNNPKIAVEVLIGHGTCIVIIETSVPYEEKYIQDIIHRIAGEEMLPVIRIVQQDQHLSKNQEDEIRCGDNGIFKGVPLTENEKLISIESRNIYNKYKSDGKYILTDDKFIICQSNAKNEELKETQ